MVAIGTGGIGFCRSRCWTGFGSVQGHVRQQDKQWRKSGIRWKRFLVQKPAAVCGAAPGPQEFHEEERKESENLEKKENHAEPRCEKQACSEGAVRRQGSENWFRDLPGRESVPHTAFINDCEIMQAPSFRCNHAFRARNPVFFKCLNAWTTAFAKGDVTRKDHLRYVYK